MALFTTEESPAAEYRKTLAQPEQNTPWLNSQKHTILLYGGPKIGKTYAYCSLIKETIDKGNNVFIISTDGGFIPTFKAYFKQDAEKYAQKITYVETFNTNQGITQTNKALAKMKQGDWVIVDLFSDYYQMAQDEFFESIGMEPSKYIQLASDDPKKFGLYDSSKWNYIKRLDNLITEVLPKRGQFNLLAVCAAKDIEPQKKIAKMKQHPYDDVGFMPSGQKEIAHRFNTIVYLGGFGKRFFKIVGHRGQPTNITEVTYDEQFWPALKKLIEVQP